MNKDAAARCVAIMGAGCAMGMRFSEEESEQLLRALRWEPVAVLIPVKVTTDERGNERCHAMKSGR